MSDSRTRTIIVYPLDIVSEEINGYNISLTLTDYNVTLELK